MDKTRRRQGAKKKCRLNIMVYFSWVVVLGFSISFAKMKYPEDNVWKAF
jgi:hypothetical protein